MRVTRLTKLLSWVAMASVMTFAGNVAAQTTHLFDNFDSYADQAAFQAVWGVGFSGLDNVTPAPTNILLTNDMTGGNPNAVSGTQMVGHPADGNRNQRNFAETGMPSASNVISFSFDFFDTNAAAAPYRQHHNLMDTAFPVSTNGLVSMGLSNNLGASDQGGNYYMGRVLGAAANGGSAGAFFKLNDTGAPLRSTGWHNLRVDITSDDNLSTDYYFYVDGILSETVLNVGTAATIRSYDQIRLGSGLTPLGNLAYTDNISVVLNPDGVPVEDDADFDGDGDVDGADFLTWQRHVSIDDGTANLVNGDANDDGNVDNDDLAIWKLQHGTATAAVQAIPEPASLALAGLALVAGLAASRRR